MATARKTPSRAAARKATPRRSPPARLRTYNRKRDFARTAEPRGESPATAGRSFVIQQHDATRMHYDFRLEHRGVLLSWAVPKGPSLDPAHKRLAVQTEDHPVSYREFEGHIPHGEYGGGPVIVWDRGHWDPEIDPDVGMRKGHLSFTLDGEKLQGRFQLVRLPGEVQQGPKSNWLLFKSRDEHAHAGPAADITARRPESVISGRRVEQIEDAPMAAKKKAAAPRKAKSTSPGRSKKSGAAAMPLLSSLDPQLATLVDGAPPGSDWVYEVKFDGYRMLASIDGHAVGLRSRNDLDWTGTLPHIVAALKTLECRRAILDGELCHVDDSGKTSFQKLQNEMPRGKGSGTPSKHLVYFIFDLLHLDGVDMRSHALVERKAALQKLLGGKPASLLAYSDHLQGDGHTAFLQACRAGLEGLIAKRASAPYREGRGRDWLKLKCQKRQEFVIVGFARATGTREGFRSLVLGTRDGGPLKFAGRVGTGFTQESLRDLARKLKPRITDASPLENPPRLPGVTWVRPELVCEVQYAEITAEGSLRHPSFQGLREDKPARKVEREKALPVKTSVSRRSSSAAKEDDGNVMGVRISHPERVMDSSSGVTKLDLARYHEAVQAFAMPYLANRPLSLVRCPDGGAHQCFFQKHVMPGVGKHVHKGRAGGNEILFVDEVVGLIELVQFNAIELHGWGATMNDPDHPDWFVIDLDPDTSLKFADVVDAALEVREALKSLKLQSWVKTTGGKGLHVVVPIKPEQDWEHVKGFTQAVARSLETQNPKRYVSTMAKAKRVGKIFVDYLRNGQGATAVLPYSPRARPGATVAMPVAWKDLKGLDPKEFTVNSAARWLAKRRQDPWADFLSSAQGLPALD